jgi:exodeoxyribonuclease-3
MKITSWNVNSLKVRLPQVLQWLQTENPDVLALQELKQESHLFPEKEFHQLGYHYCEVNGQKTYNGVAIISKHKIESSETPDLDEQHRIISATINKVKIINVYVPNGESVESPKYTYKLNWLKYFTQYLTEQQKLEDKIIILGDFNIAPEDQDVHDSALWHEKVLCTTAERKAFQEILQLGFADSFRLFEQPAKSYSWWDYRMLGFRRNAGMRIDHVLVSQHLSVNCKQSTIDKTPRKWERPSDHAPVTLDIML